MQTQFVRVKPGIFLTWSPSFFENHLPPHPTPRRGQKSIVPGAQETTRPADNLPRLPTSPGVPNSQGLSLSLYSRAPLPVVPPSQGVPIPVPGGTGACHGHSPTQLRGGAWVNLLRQPHPTELTRIPCPAGPAACLL